MIPPCGGSNPPAPTTPGKQSRARRGGLSYGRGLAAEQAACAALIGDGWTILGRRLRTDAGELDIVAERDGLLAILEVKARPSLAEAAYAITERQRRRLLGAAAAMLANHPTWGRNGIRFDVIVVDATCQVRRIIDAFRQET